jgi:25S rRNA (uracil2843-N3)-methyltransferase
MLCIGGCAAEHVAFAAHLHEENLPGALHLVDAAPWGHATALLQRQLTTPPPLSKYASEAARAASVSFLEDEQLAFTFTQADILSLGVDDLRKLVGSQALVVTLLFTLNELYTEGGIGKTTSLLGNLGRVLPAGSLLLVVDSPGSYSEAALGREKKRYPMQWLLRHTLLGEGDEAMGTGTGTGTWEQLESEDSVWFRLPEGLAYPIPLENMRYQVHLYRVRKR